ncbi:MAG TPA: 4,5-DOPA dioxygenase extradiol [Tenuifilaceae bacterium]|nr:4,5-DOPA dioxygenase extradiol [Tenuifilaceae bacterium]HPE18683.1 4,5-DOPA dioxygenase extradiol [Tenuifilaceae bacterium]HPJ45544.1 4,5-DOPA dioxygenase extradiol [Tenuifilaceae bacterium]HPQ33802.1 4,5-DOPA dioxygenase extradiol [Tenuifilaceae bacterium]HRX68614.1 4,5-DOPA dioxygenase extradiol [Tenuifilaceae bacterium]
MNEVEKILGPLDNSPKMPVLFLGHGSPMNAIEENEFVQGFRTIAKEIPTPKAIICVSAHWETNGTLVTAMENPRTIHDFGGFPRELYEVQYPAKGNPQLASEVKNAVQTTSIELDNSWGLDHGSWSVVKHLYPNSEIPIIQLSLNFNKTPQQHYELGKELAVFRQKGILIVGSGNMVHNLGLVAWNKINRPEYGYDWAIEANERMKLYMKNHDHESLINYKKLGTAFTNAIPSPDHYLPLLYSLALQGKKDQISIFNDKVIGGSLSMASIIIKEN